MKLYQVEYRAVITVEADDLLTAELDASAFIKENPHVIRVRGAREINCAAPARQIPTDTFRAPGRSIVPMSCATADLTSADTAGSSPAARQRLVARDRLHGRVQFA